MERITIYTHQSGMQKVTTFEHATNLKTMYGGWIEEHQFLNVDPFCTDNIEITKEEVIIRYTINDGEPFDFYISEPLNLEFDGEHIRHEYISFKGYALTESEVKEINAMIERFCDTLGREDFENCYESR